MVYLWAGIIISVLFLVLRIIRSIHLPKVAKERTKRVVERQRQRTKRVVARRGKRQRKKPSSTDVKDDIKPQKKGIFKRIFPRKGKKWTSKKLKKRSHS